MFFFRHRISCNVRTFRLAWSTIIALHINTYVFLKDETVLNVTCTKKVFSVAGSATNILPLFGGQYNSRFKPSLTSYQLTNKISTFYYPFWALSFRKKGAMLVSVLRARVEYDFYVLLNASTVWQVLKKKLMMQSWKIPVFEATPVWSNTSDILSEHAYNLIRHQHKKRRNMNKKI